MEKIRCHLKFDNMFVVPQRHLSAGLALLWMNELDLHIRTFSPYHIDTVVNPRIDDAWRFTGFYGALETINREDSWSLLCYFSTQIDLLWLYISDLKKITRLEEKLGGAMRLKKQMQKFRDGLDYCGLKDLGFSGLPFTWCNRRYKGPLVLVQFDRVVASTK
ncbi:hypothetical protein ACB092_05G094200 [Castanea dentata]